MSELTGRPSTSGLIADAMSQMARLVESEVRLVRTEIGEKVSAAVRAVAIIAVSAVVLLAAVFLILIGIVHLVIYFGLQPFVAYFAVGGVAAVIGAIAVYIALRQLRPSGLAPRRSINQISKDAQAIKEQMS
jgi:uncharacterized membrane protein YqjE